MEQNYQDFIDYYQDLLDDHKATLQQDRVEMNRTMKKVMKMAHKGYCTIEVKKALRDMETIIVEIDEALETYYERLENLKKRWQIQD